MEKIKPQFVPKPWGHELWLAHTSQYAGKILFVKKGHRYSLQFHEQKSETQYLLKGKIKFIYGETAENLEEIILNPGEALEIKPPMIHRVEALEDSEIIEISTPELDDVVKLHDDYGRSGSGNNFAADQLLHQENHS